MSSPDITSTMSCSAANQRPVDVTGGLGVGATNISKAFAESANIVNHANSFNNSTASGASIGNALAHYNLSIHDALAAGPSLKGTGSRFSLRATEVKLAVKRSVLSLRRGFKRNRAAVAWMNADLPTIKISPSTPEMSVSRRGGSAVTLTVSRSVGQGSTPAYANNGAFSLGPNHTLLENGSYSGALFPCSSVSSPALIEDTSPMMSNGIPLITFSSEEDGDECADGVSLRAVHGSPAHSLPASPRTNSSQVDSLTLAQALGLGLGASTRMEHDLSAESSGPDIASAAEIAEVEHLGQKRARREMGIIEKLSTRSPTLIWYIPKLSSGLRQRPFASSSDSLARLSSTSDVHTLPLVKNSSHSSFIDADGNLDLLCAIGTVFLFPIRALVFFPWVLSVGITALLFPHHIRSVSFPSVPTLVAGMRSSSRTRIPLYASPPPDTLYALAHYARALPVHVSTVFICLGGLCVWAPYVGAGAVCTMVALTCWVWRTRIESQTLDKRTVGWVFRSVIEGRYDFEELGRLLDKEMSEGAATI